MAESSEIRDVKFVKRMGKFDDTWEVVVYLEKISQKIKAVAKKLPSDYDQEIVHKFHKVKHPNILTFFGTYCRENDLFVIMEFAEKGSLFANLKECKVPLAKSRVYQWVRYLADGIDCLHRNGMVHRDIKSNHVFLTADNVLKIDCFGLAKEMEQTKGTGQKSGNCGWMAPEVIRLQIRSPKSDVFSFAVVIWELVTGKVPYCDKKGDFLVMNDVCGGGRLPIPDNCPEDLAHLMEICWQEDHKKRPDMKEVLQILDKARSSAVYESYQYTMQSGTYPCRRIRLMIVGEPNVGKTSITKSLIRTFSNASECVLDNVDQETELSNINIWHVTNKKLSNGTKTSICKAQKELNCSCIAKAVVKNLPTMDQQPGSVKTITEVPRKNLPDSTKMVPSSIQRAIDEELQHTELSDTDSDTDITMSIWDFAGQDLYYTTHQVFLSNTATYILVFKLVGEMERKDKQKIWQKSTILDYLDYWMRSIYTYTARKGDTRQQNPLVILVGTHVDSVSKEEIKDTFDTIRTFFHDKCYKDQVYSEIFAVENCQKDVNNDQIVHLTTNIMEVAEKESYIRSDIPHRWLTFEVKVAEAVEIGQKILTKQEVRQLLCTHFPDIDDEELSNMLQFFHDLGVIISSQAVVILDPTYLIDIFRITTSVPDINLRHTDYVNDWEKLDTSGILTDRLLNFLWGELKITAYKYALLDLLETFDLVYQLSTDKSTYWVPSKLTTDRPTDKELFSNSAAVTFYIDFHGFLPVGVFHMIMINVARWSKQINQSCDHEPQLYFDSLTCMVDKYQTVTMLMEQPKNARIKVAISNGKEDVEKPPSQQICRKVRKFLTDAVEDVRNKWTKGIQYAICIECPCGTNPLHFLDMELCLSSEENQCSQGKSVNTKQLQDWFNEQTTQQETKKEGQEEGRLETDSVVVERFPHQPKSSPVKKTDVKRKNINKQSIIDAKEENEINFNDYSDSINNTTKNSASQTSETSAIKIDEKRASSVAEKSSSKVNESYAKPVNERSNNYVKKTNVSPDYTTESSLHQKNVRSQKLSQKETRLPPEDVRIHIMTEPRTDGLRFASSDTTRDLQDSSKLKGQEGRLHKDTTPSFYINNYTGQVNIVAWLTTEEGAHFPHPHMLEGTDCSGGIFSVHTYLEKPGQPIRLPDVHIVGVPRENITQELNQRTATLKMRCPTMDFHTSKASEYDLSRVLLCIMGYIPDINYHIPLAPKTTLCLYDKGNIVRREPRILQMSESKGPVSGGQKVKLVVARLQPDEGTVLYTLNTTDPPSTWQHLAKIIESFAQKSTIVITISTPSFYNKDITSPVTVKVQVRRVDGAYSNFVLYTFLPNKDDSVSITKKVNIRRPIFQNHFCCIGAASMNLLEWDENEFQMDQPVKKKPVRKPLSNQEMAEAENLHAVIDRIPHVIPHRPLPKPKKKSSGAAGETHQRSADVSDVATSDDPEQLRKYKAFSATHGFKKTVNRIQDFVENIRDMEAFPEEGNLPPASEDRRARDVSDWVSSTVQAATPNSESTSGHEGASHTVEMSRNNESELMTIKAIAEGSATYVTNVTDEADCNIHDHNDRKSPSLQLSSESIDDEVKCKSGDYCSDGDNREQNVASKYVEEKSMGAVGGLQSSASLEKTEASTLQNIEKVYILDDKVYKWCEDIGKGSFGSVFRVEVTNMEQFGVNVKEVAVRKASVVSNSKEVVNTLVMLSHPNIVSVYGILHHESEVFLAMEYMSYGSLERYLCDFVVPDTKILGFACDVASAIEYLHDKEIVHGNISQRNCYILGEDILKVRVLTISSDCTKEADVFAFGTFLFNILPAPESAQQDKTSTTEPKDQARYSEKVKELMSSCWKKSPKARPSMKRVKHQLEMMEGLYSTAETHLAEDSANETNTCSSLSSVSTLSSTSTFAALPKEDSGFCYSSYKSPDPQQQLITMEDANLTPISTSGKSKCEAVDATSSNVLQLVAKTDVQLFEQQTTKDPVETSAKSLPTFPSTKFDSCKSITKMNSATNIRIGRLEVDACMEGPISSHRDSSHEYVKGTAKPRPQILPGGIQKQEGSGLESYPEVKSAGAIQQQDIQPVTYPKEIQQQDRTDAPQPENPDKVQTPKPQPSMMKKIVDHTGGSLKLEGYNITLTIPEGALPKEPKEITLEVVWEDKYTDIKGTHCNVSPKVRCLPTGLQFNEPVAIRIPHCAVLEETMRYKSQVHCNEKDADQTPEWKTVSSTSTDYPRTEIFEDHILLQVMHFTDYWVTIDGIEHKRLKMVVYTSKLEHVEGEQHIRVYLHNDHEPAQKKVEAEELENCGIKNLPTQTFLYEKSKHPMTVTLLHHTRGWNLIYGELENKIPFKKIWHNEMVSSHFMLTNSTQMTKFLCMIQARQENNEDTADIKIANHVVLQTRSSSTQRGNLPPLQMNAYRQSYQELTSCGSSGDGPHTLSSYRSEKQQVVVAGGSYDSVTGRRYGTQISKTYIHPSQLASSDHSGYSDQEMLALQAGTVVALPPCGPRGSLIREEFLPFIVENKLCKKLNPKDPMGNDWRMLADKVGFNSEDIDGLECSDNPTKALLKCIKTQELVKSPKELAECLKCIKRHDAANIINDYLVSVTSPNSITSPEPMNTRNSSFDSSSPEIDVTQELVTPTPIENTRRTLVCQFEAAQTDPHCSTESQSQSISGHKIFSPPVDNTSEPQVCYKSSTTSSTVTSKGFLANSNHSSQTKKVVDSTRIAPIPSNGPTNVQPQENQSLEGELQVDGNEGIISSSAFGNTNQGSELEQE